MTSFILLLSITVAAAATEPPSAPSTGDARQDDYELRLRNLETKVDAMADDMIASDLGAATGSELEPGSRKVYGLAQGVSIGGYGEVSYQNVDEGTDEFDLHRVVLYFGYKFDELWVFNSEIELEHTDEISAEFAYLDYLHDDSLNVRGGLVLLPMGFVNRQHEPTAYLGANRPLTESFVIPTTWRENGAGIYGDLDGFQYEAYVVNGFDGSGFGGTSGLRGGRQKGGKAKAEDFGLVASIDWTEVPGWVVGASAYVGDAGQDGDAGDLETSIVEAHAEYRAGRIWARGLASDAGVDDRDAGDMDLSGWYAEVGVDVLRDEGRAALYPFLRYEDIDTDEDAGGIDDSVLTYGLHWAPRPQIVIKLDHSDFDDTNGDVTTLMMGYVF